jgi:hypothetical protein
MNFRSIGLFGCNPPREPSQATASDSKCVALMPGSGRFPRVGNEQAIYLWARDKNGDD